MKIKKKLWFNTFISFVMGILILLSLAWASRGIILADRNMKLADEIRKVAFERILLLDEYILYREDRAKIQWHAKSEALRGLFDLMDIRFDDKEDKTLLVDARKDFDASFTRFARVLESRERRKASADTTYDFSDMELQLISQVFLKAYSMTDNINKLHESAERKATSVRNRGVFMVVLFILAGIMGIIANSTVISRALIKRITALGKGFEILGAGDLDHRIPTEGDDELSALALASNEMAAKLKQSYTSVDKLENEIAERKKAEEEREKIILELKDALARIKTLSGMLPICASCKKIRDDKGYWSGVETYISRHSDVLFSHGICPECEIKAYKELEQLKNENT